MTEPAIFLVYPRNDRWRVERDGSMSHLTFDTKANAVAAAEQRARTAQPAKVLVYDEQDRLQEQRLFGDDSADA